MCDEALSSLECKIIDHVIKPDGNTSYIEGPERSWNNPFKEHYTEKYDVSLTLNHLLISCFVMDFRILGTIFQTNNYPVIYVVHSISLSMRKETMIYCK